MQRPTCTGIRIRSTRDADILFHAVTLHILPMITRRLDSDERQALCSGCVYVWEERCHGLPEATEPGIERFTDGRSWGPSRARDDFLFYYEKVSGSGSPAGSNEQSNKMIKQTYSVYVHTTAGLRKWHLNAYYTQDTLDKLVTVDDMPALRTVVVPRSRYICARANRSRDLVMRAGECGAIVYEGQVPAGQFFAFPASPSPNGPDHDASCSPTPPSVASPPPSYESHCNQNRQPRLVPLEHLQRCTQARHPIDDEALRAFAPRIGGTTR